MSVNDCLICSKHKDQTFEIYKNDYLVINHFVPHQRRQQSSLVLDE